MHQPLDRREAAKVCKSRLKTGSEASLAPTGRSQTLSLSMLTFLCYQWVNQSTRGYVPNGIGPYLESRLPPDSAGGVTGISGAPLALGPEAALQTADSTFL